MSGVLALNLALVTLGFVLVVNPQTVPVNSVAELTAYIKARPGKLAYASGNATGRVTAEWYRQIAGFDAVHVPYKGVPQAMTDVMGGQVNVMLTDLPPGAVQVKAGKMLGLPEAPLADYEALRLSLGVPDGSRDLPVEKALLLESGFDELHGVDWQKGCYMGQELTARTKYRALIRKRLFPVRVEGPLPPPGATVHQGGEEVGELRSGAGDRALALLRLDAVRSGTPLSAGDARLVAEIPSWMRLPEASAP